CPLVLEEVVLRLAEVPTLSEVEEEMRAQCPNGVTVASERIRDGLGESLRGLLEGEGVGSSGLCVRFPGPLPAHSTRLLATLGVVVVIDPDAPILSQINTNGRSGTTRSEMTDEVRARQPGTRRQFRDTSTCSPRLASEQSKPSGPLAPHVSRAPRWLKDIGALSPGDAEIWHRSAPTAPYEPRCVVRS